jgi:hypothetical protein
MISLFRRLPLRRGKRKKRRRMKLTSTMGTYYQPVMERRRFKRKTLK